MTIRPVRKAVFPVAGLGTRLLPATKASPKEMLTIVDKPLIQYAVEEARGDSRGADALTVSPMVPITTATSAGTRSRSVSPVTRHWTKASAIAMKVKTRCATM
mgnify:CR=1 FL=1